MTSDEIKALRELLGKATPGEWRVYLADVRDAQNRVLLSGHGTRGKLEPERADAQLTVALRNAAGPLLDAAEECERLRGEIRGARVTMDMAQRHMNVATARADAAERRVRELEVGLGEAIGMLPIGADYARHRLRAVLRNGSGT